jgi:peroxiredoxin
MRGFFLVGVSIGALLLFSPSASAQDLEGKPAPEFSLKNMTGKTVSLSDYEGKVVLLDFWAVWCGPCKTSLPFLETLRKKYARHGFDVVGLHVDDRRPPLDQVMSYIRERNVHYTNLMSTFEVDEAFQLAGIPTSFVIGRDGKVQRMHVGFNPETTPAKIEAQVREVLGLP